LYNNYISAFEFENPNHPYFIRPNMIPWTSVSPSFVYYNEKLWMVVGSPGSARIFSTIAQFLSRIIDGDLSMKEAVERPRFHCSVNGKVSLEIDGFKSEVIDNLKKLGYDIDPRERYSFFHGAIHAVMKCQTRDEYHGVAEIRRDGTAAGLD
jgi:gamma-glutamyltranspeptidase/glutathione hydrolase